MHERANLHHNASGHARHGGHLRCRIDGFHCSGDRASRVDPSAGMTLSGIELFDANGNPITDFSLTSGSGAVYGADGLVREPISSTPEPAMAWLLSSGFLLVIVVARIR